MLTSSGADPGQMAARSVGSLHPPMRPPPPPKGGDSQRMMRGMSAAPPAHHHQSSDSSAQPPVNQPPPQPVKPKPGLKVEDFRHDPATGIFSVTLPTGVTLTSKNPFDLQSQVLMSAKRDIRPALASMMTEVTMQWSSCMTPPLQDVANDAVDDARKQAYLESARLLCSVRDKVPTPKIDVLRHKCMTMEDTVKWLLDLQAAKPEDVVHKVGLAEKKYYHLATGKLNEDGKTKVDSLSDEQRGELKAWFHRSDADIQRWVMGRCIDPSSASENHPPKPLHGVHRVCVFNLRKAYDNQAASVLKAVSDHEKLTRGRRTILIFVAVLLVVVVIVIIIVVVLRNKKRAKEQALIANLPSPPSHHEAHGASLPTHNPTPNHNPTPDHHESQNPFVKSLMGPSYPSVPDPIDADIDRLALEIPK